MINDKGIMIHSYQQHFCHLSLCGTSIQQLATYCSTVQYYFGRSYVDIKKTQLLLLLLPSNTFISGSESLSFCRCIHISSSESIVLITSIVVCILHVVWTWDLETDQLNFVMLVTSRHPQI